jgi:CRP-like cAMP-binding protein
MITLEDILKRQYSFSESDLETTRVFFAFEIIKAKDHFLRAGKIAHKLGFVQSGLLCSYYYGDDGREITLQFYPPGTVAISPDSFNNKTPALDYIMAYEQSDLLTISFERFQQLCSTLPVWQEISRTVADTKSKRLADRIMQFQTLTAEQRYRNFCQEYPQLALQVPLGHIASYLGMDIATLSRLRNKR